MDPQRFDAMARMLATPGTRRRFLAGLAAAVGLVGLHPAEAATCRSGGRVCSKDAHCCSSVCHPKDATNRRICAKHLGEKSSNPAECASGIVADGVCCDQACSGQCEACNLKGKAGVCSPVTGAPTGGRPACGGNGACAGTCNGSDGRGCSYPGDSTTCKSSACNDNGDSFRYTCDGVGTCARSTVDCGLNVCRDGICVSGCASNDDCIGAAYCRNGTCAADLADGAPCTERGQCQGGACVEGLCTSKQPNGASCSSSGGCLSGFCTDGVCCDRACTGTCEVCNESGSAGTCTFVRGQPRNGRPACGGSGECKGGCFGTGPDCGIPVGKVCGTPYCDEAANAKIRFACSNAGECVQNSPQYCAPYRCNDDYETCLNFCFHDAVCADGAHCTGDSNHAGVCVVSLLPYGGACSSSSQCQSNNCQGGACACTLDEKRCGDTCIPALSCCTDDDCGGDAICQRKVCNRGTHTCEWANVESDPRCVTDPATCQSRSCQNGSCQEGLVVKPFYWCHETVCDGQGNWVQGPPKVCNTPGPGQKSPGVCHQGSGCVYPSVCALCQTWDGTKCVDNCPPDTMTSCTDGAPGRCNLSTEFCEYTIICGECEYCGFSRACEPYQDGSVVDGQTCCGGERQSLCTPGVCGAYYEDVYLRQQLCCGEVTGHDCCEAPNGMFEGECCPPGTVAVCGKRTILTGPVCCDHECYVNPLTGLDSCSEIVD
jgi:hypothetical protein